MSQDKPRDLEADLKIATAIPPDPDDPDFINDVVLPHALRRAIAAEAELTKEREANRLLIEEREQLKLDKLEIARHLGEEIAGLEYQVAEQDKELQHRKNYEAFLKLCIACGEPLEKSGFDKYEYWLEKYLSISK